MKTTIEQRWSTHPEDVKHYTTKDLRREFLVEKIFSPDEIIMTYTHNDRLIIGGAAPAKGDLKLPSVDLIRSDFFCQRRELGIVCIENEGTVIVDGASFDLSFKDALYVGRGAK